jgi:hypothetical protein
MAATLDVHRRGVFGLQLPIYAGPLEGANKKIKTTQRQALRPSLSGPFHK